MAVAAKTQQNRLDTLARDMRTAAEGSHAQSQCRLPQGLEIVLQRQFGRWRLTLAREGGWPSKEELDACLAAFHVPEGALQRRRQQCLRHPKSGRQIVESVVEVSWTERQSERIEQMA